MTRGEYAGLIALRAQIDALIAAAEEGFQADAAKAPCSHPEDRRVDIGSTWTLARERCADCGAVIETPQGATATTE